MKKNNKKNMGLNASDEQKEVVTFLIILVTIVFIVISIYFFSNKIMNKNVYFYDQVTTGVVNESIVTVGTLFNRPMKEYYVAIYNGEDIEAVYYSTLFNKYSTKEDALKIYFCDLNNKLNENYLVKENESSNKEAKTIDEVKFGKFTFVKIKDGKIAKYLESVEEVKEELKLEEE
ncbi:MAG: hypothetical protein E7172_02245 [Firmicutes bacterium]|nr:hypothetical protein [Bacillota bacterium]